MEFNINAAIKIDENDYLKINKINKLIQEENIFTSITNVLCKEFYFKNKVELISIKNNLILEENKKIWEKYEKYLAAKKSLNEIKRNKEDQDLYNLIDKIELLDQKTKQLSILVEEIKELQDYIDKAKNNENNKLIKMLNK